MTPTRLLPLLAATLALAAPAPGARGQDRPLALKGATIETVGEAGRIETGVIVLRDGKIERVGPIDEVEIPEDARVEDASGMTIMPGVVEPAYPFQVPGESSSSGTRTIIIGGRVITLGGSSPTRSPIFTRVADSFDPFRADFDALLRSGLTHLDLVPPDYGQTAVVRITPDDPDGMLVERDGRLYVSVSNSTASLDVVRKGLEATKPDAPGGGRGRPDGPTGRGRSGGDGASGRPGGPPSPGSSSADSSRDLWKAVAEGKAPLLADAGNAAAILYLLDAIEDFEDVEVALIASGSDVYRTLDRLSGRGGVTLLLRPTIDTMPDNRDRINLPRIAHEAGLDLAFSQGGNRFGLLSAQDTPLFDVGYLIATGLPREVALEALTARPADLIGQGDALGRLEEGKAASLLVFDGDPFDPYSRLRTVIIAGRTVYETD
ncbi:amidohydrolase family protein [Tautonia plasticadhaerens]|uniref:Imidazolonepropionase n=1 Tax=Tautonia plasticadhaerens TaxID=2527974 RepID=A0A518H102_9BACT|nr:amidohydrolase family protein [Tautonia plasticadhaerens]QDV34536.1 imidazolonepropionase [Tautonia plasticadhaerens]